VRSQVGDLILPRLTSRYVDPKAWKQHAVLQHEDQIPPHVVDVTSTWDQSSKRDDGSVDSGEEHQEEDEAEDESEDVGAVTTPLPTSLCTKETSTRVPSLAEVQRLISLCPDGESSSSMMDVVTDSSAGLIEVDISGSKVPMPLVNEETWIDDLQVHPLFRTLNLPLAAELYSLPHRVKGPSARP
jgi:hypothetical protein